MPLWIIFSQVAVPSRPPLCSLRSSFVWAAALKTSKHAAVSVVFSQNKRATSAQIYDVRSSSVHCLLAQRPLVMDVTRCPSRSHFSVCLHGGSGGAGGVWLRGCLLVVSIHLLLYNTTMPLACVITRRLPRQTDSSSGDGLYRYNDDCSVAETGAQANTPIQRTIFCKHKNNYAAHCRQFLGL